MIDGTIRLVGQSNDGRRFEVIASTSDGRTWLRGGSWTGLSLHGQLVDQDLAERFTRIATRTYDMQFMEPRAAELLVVPWGTFKNVKAVIDVHDFSHSSS